ncbi:MAG: TonB-dependent siderophore receptor [Acinetobacter sp.]
MHRSQPYFIRGQKAFQFSLLSVMIMNAHQLHAADASSAAVQPQAAPPAANTAVLSTITIEAMSELDPVKSYVDYDQANVTRNGLKKKDIPQTVDTIDVQKYKIYGSNDLSVMLQGTPGVSTSYDARGDGITLRGFSADSGDIYRDGVRESGQVRRSTANIERIEILKGPASVLYGRSAGGGVVNMVSKFANFDSKSSVGTYAGSYDNYGATADINQVLNDNLAVRLTGEYGESGSFRSGIENKIEMLSPSFTYKNDDETLTWTTQYTYDKLHRVPDRGPSYSNLPEGVSIKSGFAQDGDFIEDELQVIRTDVKYQYAPNWNFHWALSYRQAYQNFDNFFGGTYCSNNMTLAAKPEACSWNGYVRQSYAWQETMNKTITNTFDISGAFNTGALEHKLLLGADVSREERSPKLGNYSSGTGVPRYYGFINPYNPADQYHTLPGSERLPLTSDNHHVGEALGFFAQDLISLTPELKMMLGMRYDQYNFKSTNNLQNLSKQYDDATFSPNVGFVWQPSEQHSFYTSYNKSFAPYGGRGYISVDVNTDPSLYDAEPQYNEQYEIGVKSDWLDKRINTQLSVYDIRKKNLRYQPDSKEQPFLWSVGGEHQSKGLEFSFIGQALDNVFVRGGYGYTDTEVKKDKEKPANVGNALANTSKNTGNLFVRYLPTENLYGEIGVTYVGSYYTNINNLNKMDSFNRVDAAIGYSADPWNVTLAVSNLTNKEYWRSDSMPGTPRSFLMRLNYQF